MGIFGQSSPFDTDVEKATSETNTNDNWSFILDVCDKVTTNPKGAKDCLKAIMKRMGHADPHVVMQAITLLDACANNCGKLFHLEVASRDFETEFKRLLTKAQPKISLKMRQVLKNWAENDFKNDPELNLIPSLYATLRSEGYDFSNLNDKPTKSVVKTALPKDPNVVSSKQEEDDIAKAIELSLKESQNSPKQSNSNSSGVVGNSAYPSLYPSFGTNLASSIVASGSISNVNSQPEPRKVRALYDFEAAEENELTFFAGDILHVVDDSDSNWWKGFNQGGEGLFPSNFVTADLSVDPETLDINQQHKSQSDEKRNAAQEKTDLASENAIATANQPVEINEAKIDRLLHLLHEANPEDPSQDSEEMLCLEQEVHRMGPLIDSELERVDRKHAQLTQLSSDLVDAINLYHSLMRDDRIAQFSSGPSGAFTGSTIPGGLPYQGFYSSTGFQNSATAGVFPLNQPNFGGGTSLPYTSAPQISISGGYPLSLGNQVSQTPLQYQNGHGHQLNSLPPQMLPHSQIQQSASSPPQIFGATVTPSSVQQLQQQQQQHTKQTFQIMQPSEQQQNFSQQMSISASAPSTATPIPPAINPQQTQFLPVQHQISLPYIAGQQHPAQAQSFAQVLPNGPQTFFTAAPSNGHVSIPQPSQVNVNNIPHINANSPGMDQFNHMQNQMSAMSMGIIHSVAAAPVTTQTMPLPPVGTVPPPQQSFVMQNDITNNIPIYQQQQ